MGVFSAIKSLFFKPVPQTLKDKKIPDNGPQYQTVKVTETKTVTEKKPAKKAPAKKPAAPKAPKKPAKPKAPKKPKAEKKAKEIPPPPPPPEPRKLTEGELPSPCTIDGTGIVETIPPVEVKVKKPRKPKKVVDPETESVKVKIED